MCPQCPQASGQEADGSWCPCPCPAHGGRGASRQHLSSGRGCGALCCHASVLTNRAHTPALPLLPGRGQTTEHTPPQHGLQRMGHVTMGRTRRPLGRLQRACVPLRVPQVPSPPGCPRPTSALQGLLARFGQRAGLWVPGGGGRGGGSLRAATCPVTWCHSTPTPAAFPSLWPEVPTACPRVNRHSIQHPSAEGGRGLWGWDHLANSLAEMGQYVLWARLGEGAPESLGVLRWTSGGHPEPASFS